MSRRRIISLLVVALWTCLAAAEPPQAASPAAITVPDADESGLPSAADPNRTWEPAAHLTGDWTAVSVSSRIDQDSNVPARSVAVTASVDVIDPNNFLGLSRTPTAVVTLGADGEQVCSISAARDGIYWPPKTTWWIKAGVYVPHLNPYAVSVNIPLDPNRACPALLSTVEWSTYALVAGKWKTIDLPYQSSDSWVDVAPGLQVQVTRATGSYGHYEYSLLLKYDSMKICVVPVAGKVTVGGVGALPEVIVWSLDLLDAQGKSIELQAWNGRVGAPQSGSTERIDTLFGDASSTTCGPVVTLRFNLGLDAYEKPVRITLQDIPIPALSY